MRIENYSPLDPIHAVFTGKPGTEAVLGLLMPPEESLFEQDASNSASIVAAREDHTRMTESLAQHGIHIYNMRAIIGEQVALRNTSRFESPEQILAELKFRANKLHEQYSLGNLELVHAELEQLIRTDVVEMGRDNAVAINAVLANCIDIDGNEKPFNLENKPFANFMFWRDTNHITADTMGTHKMFLNIRDQEVLLAELALESLGVRYQRVMPRNSKASIEGGDVLPMELNNRQYAMVGQAERTSWEGVQAWFALHESSFSQSGDGIIPMVIEGPNHDTQTMMHLDTYAQQVAPGAVIHCEKISNDRHASILTRRGGKIVKVDTVVYTDWIEKHATQIYPMSREEQLLYGPNVLVDGGQTVYITRDDTPAVTNFIRSVVLETVVLGLNNLTKLYGGTHCSTSETRKR